MSRHPRVLTAGAVVALAAGLAGAAVAPATAAPTAIGLSIDEGAVLHGTVALYASGDPSPTLAVDGSNVDTSPASSLPALLRFDGDGIQSGSQNLKNSIWVNGRMVAEFRQDVNQYATAEFPIPAGFLKEGANRVVIRAGSSLSPTDLTRNHDDFTVRNVRLVTLDQRELADPAIDPAKVIALGDGYPGGNAKEELVTAPFDLTLDARAATGVVANIETKALTDGTHTLTTTSGSAARTLAFMTDNSGPQITSITPADGSTVDTDRLSLEVTATDSVSSVTSITGTLDGRKVNIPDSFPAGNIVAGEHTLKVTATDAAGNATTRTVTFTTPQSTIARGAYDRGQIYRGANSGPNAPKVVAAGDIACASTSKVTPTACQHAAVADVVKAQNPDAVLTLADTQYDVSTLPAILASYDKSWGALKDITYPIVGNHEYGQAYFPGARADGYFDYFNGIGAQDGRAGDREKGYYSYDIGRWHVVALNTECGVVSCAPGSGQYAWLEQDLKAHRNSCTMAVWHKPVHTGTFRGGMYGNPDGRPLYELADRHGVDVILNGHDHNYQRFAPQDVDGNAKADAPRSFIVGSGGVGFHGMPDQVANLETAQSDTFGALALTLRPTGYDWEFVGVPGSGSGYTDSGSATCTSPVSRD